MMMTRTIIATALLAAGATPAFAQPAPVNVGAGQSGQTIRLARGQALNVAVTACVGCPYRWTVLTPRQLTRTSLTQVPPADDGRTRNPIDGGSRSDTYHFTAARAGRGQLRLNYAPFVQGLGTRGNQSLVYTIIVQ